MNLCNLLSMHWSKTEECNLLISAVLNQMNFFYEAISVFEREGCKTRGADVQQALLMGIILLPCFAFYKLWEHFLWGLSMLSFSGHHWNSDCGVFRSQVPAA